ncbi:MAG: cardiolipin synthase, partial [Paramuribaculum sp.]|nr:cardiolipin synthase [Paramuribaculum sp.]
TYASYSYILECLRSSIKIYLYDEGMLHSKTMIIDNDFCSIGSANIDFRSFEHNFESTMMIYSRKANSELKHQFMIDQSHSTRLFASSWRKRPLIQKAKESLVRLLSPIL